MSTYSAIVSTSPRDLVYFIFCQVSTNFFSAFGPLLVFLLVGIGLMNLLVLEDVSGLG